MTSFSQKITTVVLSLLALGLPQSVTYARSLGGATHCVSPSPEQARQLLSAKLDDYLNQSLPHSSFLNSDTYVLSHAHLSPYGRNTAEVCDTNMTSATQCTATPFNVHMNENNLRHGSDCPWKYVLTVNRSRFPQIMVEAHLTGSSSSRCPGDSECVAVTHRVPVLFPTNPNAANTICNLTLQFHKIAVGFTCARN